ncbi:hypothetical protein C0993_010549 [Termitomyces sp. T159_Od127]|nr:hypothetical protein C0993_010549 [Termitomyces sp. T159_Od127]
MAGKADVETGEAYARKSYDCEERQSLLPSTSDATTTSGPSTPGKRFYYGDTANSQLLGHYSSETGMKGLFCGLWVLSLMSVHSSEILQIMRFSVFATAAVLYAASLEFVAADCWRANWCPDGGFENSATMQAFATSYCADNWNKVYAHASYGLATASHQGQFTSQANCNLAFDDIITCLGTNNGGYEEVGSGR